MDIFMQVSLVAAFVAGMVALFAPCCITFLLPAYLGSVFKEKEKVLLMTLVFGLGIFVVLLPAVLGVALVSQAITKYHDMLYALGGLVMIVVSITTFLGIKLPMPAISMSTTGQKTDVFSIFTMGIFSGITSACCAPVLIGVLTLSLLSPSFLGAILVGGVYVFGMVTPLLLIALFLSNRIPSFSFLRRPVMIIRLIGEEYVVIASNVVASLIFLITGLVILVLNQTGRLSSQGMEEFTKVITNAGTKVDQLVGSSALANIAVVIGVAVLLITVAKKV